MREYLWARSRPGLSSVNKAVLKELAFHANAELLAWPSQVQLAETCSLGRRTVTRALSQLEAQKLIVDTGARMGRTNQVTVWKVATEATLKVATQTDI